MNAHEAPLGDKFPFFCLFSPYKLKYRPPTLKKSRKWRPKKKV